MSLPRPGEQVISGRETSVSAQPDRSTRLSRIAIQTLPNFDRNFTQFALLAPGAELKIPQPRPSVNPQGGILISNKGLNHSGSAFVIVDTSEAEFTVNKCAHAAASLS